MNAVGLLGYLRKYLFGNFSHFTAAGLDPVRCFYLIEPLLQLQETHVIKPLPHTISMSCHDHSHPHDHDHGHGHGHSHGGDGHDHSDDITPALQNLLYEQIEFDKLVTLNEATPGSGKKIAQKTWAQRLEPEPELESDADEQLLMTVPYVSIAEGFAHGTIER